MDFAGETDVAAAGKSFNTRCYVHTLSEIIEPIVKGHRNSRGYSAILQIGLPDLTHAPI
jgi:hypothetical protein